MNAYLWLIPLYIQGLMILWDDVYFHRKRGLPTWERWGHPLDTLSYIACLSYPLFNAPSETNLWVFVGLSVFSSLFITKDEFIHYKLCPGIEMWIHALAFAMHPICLGAAGYIWYKDAGQYAATVPFIIIPVVLFLIYQTVYWNFIWVKTHQT